MSNHNQKHLTLSNRTYIEQELLQKSTFSSIGSVLHKDPSTISKEVKRYSKTVPAKFSYKCNLCKHYKDCDLLSRELLCPSYNNHYCSFYCKRCYRRNPTMICPYFSPYKCDKINKPPYVCNYCEDYKSFPLNKKIYDASYAQKQYEKNLYDSRKGINMSPEELSPTLPSLRLLFTNPSSLLFSCLSPQINSISFCTESTLIFYQTFPLFPNKPLIISCFCKIIITAIGTHCSLYHNLLVPSLFFLQ